MTGASPPEDKEETPLVIKGFEWLPPVLVYGLMKRTEMTLPQLAVLLRRMTRK